MRKYMSLLKYELKNIFKEPMSLFILFFPFIMLFILGFLLPGILDKVTTPDSNATTITLLIGFVTMLAMGGYMGGLLLGFSLIDNRDEKTLINIAVSPVTVSGYTIFKIIYSYVIAVLGNLVMLGGLVLFCKDQYVVFYQGVEIGLLANYNIWEILIYSVVSALFVPTVALTLAIVAKNKIEGFAFMKMGGLILMLPALSLLNAFQDWKQYFLGIVPMFWPIKAILIESLQLQNDANLSFTLYMIIGIVIQLAMSMLFFRLFTKKMDLK